jgi:hypothetical protein
MAQLVEDQILQKARELCRNDGMAWDKRDLESSSALGVVPRGGIAEISAKTEYLRGADAVLKASEPKMNPPTVASSLVVAGVEILSV